MTRLLDTPTNAWLVTLTILSVQWQGIYFQTLFHEKQWHIFRRKEDLNSHIYARAMVLSHGKEFSNYLTLYQADILCNRVSIIADEIP